MNKTISLKISQIPTEIIELASNSIGDCSTILFYGGDVIGSGTFVQCDSCFGILTAHHVIREGIGLDSFKKGSDKKLGVAVKENFPRALEFDLLHVRPHEIARPRNHEYNEFGPDLVFLEILDEENLGTIKAHSSFWNISPQDNLVNECYNDLSSIWAVCGLPKDWIRVEEGVRDFKKVYDCKNLVGFTGIKKRFEKDGFDYFDVSVKYNAQNDIPDTFKGMSGGGLWKVILICTGKSQNLKIRDIIFSGVIFYQTDLKANRRILRSHGAKSIYEIFPRVLKKAEKAS